MYRAYARFDMAVHNPATHEACIELDAGELYNSLREKLNFSPVPDANDRGYGHATFGHLLAGYDAGYYSYLRYIIP